MNRTDRILSDSTRTSHIKQFYNNCIFFLLNAGIVRMLQCAVSLFGRVSWRQRWLRSVGRALLPSSMQRRCNVDATSMQRRCNAVRATRWRRVTKSNRCPVVSAIPHSWSQSLMASRYRAACTLPRFIQNFARCAACASREIRHSAKTARARCCSYVVK